MSSNSRKTPKNTRTRRQRPLFLQMWKELDAHVHSKEVRGLVCLQVHHIKDLPVTMEGKAVAVGWKTDAWKGEETLPVHVHDGVATFDEIFLHYCKLKPCILKNYSLWVSLVEARGIELGSFSVDLADLGVYNGSCGSNLSGTTTSFELCGEATGSKLIVSFYCSSMGAELNHEQQPRKNPPFNNRNKCFPCLPHLKRNSIKAKPESGTDNRRGSSLDSNINFITIENTLSDHLCKFDHDEEVEDDNFITMERGLVQAQSSTRLPSHDSATSEDAEIGKDFSQCKSLATMIYEEFEVDEVEDEFLRMLEESHVTVSSRVSDVTLPCKNEEGEIDSMDWAVGFGWELESIVTGVEMEVVNAKQVWRSGMDPRATEKAEYDELVMRWGQPSKGLSTFCTWAGFGSPI